MKFAASLLVLLAFSFTACNNLVTRRALYSPTKGSGPYTKYRKEGGKLPETKIPLTPMSDPLPDAATPAGPGVLP